jgi:hypothetical protein
MQKSNVVITFDGLMLFHFSQKAEHPAPGCRERCTIGILHETGDDPHRLSIKVYQERVDGTTELANPASVGMIENPRIFNQNALKGLTSFHLFRGQDPSQLPQSGCVVREPNFDEVLQIDGKDFYDNPATILWNKMTPFFATVGSFSGVNSTAHSEFCRVSEDILPVIKRSLSKPSNWSTLPDKDKHDLGPFARKMRAEIEISENESLIANAKSNGATGKVETIFMLPKPKNGVTRYVLEIDNLDEVEDKASPEFIVSNCANFTYLCDAVDIPKLPDKPIYGLTYNFDFTIDTSSGMDEDSERCDSACCLACEVRVDSQET